MTGVPQRVDPGLSAPGLSAPGLSAPGLSAPTLSAVLKAAAALIGMEVVFINELTADTSTMVRALGPGLATWPQLVVGSSTPRRDSFCHAMLSGAPHASSEVGGVPAYAEVARRQRVGVTSYVGVPIVDDRGAVLGTLCGIDRGHVVVGDTALEVLQRLADVVAAQLTGARDGVRTPEPTPEPKPEPAHSGTVVRRGPHGWQVGAEPAEDLVCALVLADLLDGAPNPPTRPASAESAAGETERLRTAVAQLEHALANRVVVEQAIGALAQRDGVTPREAFQQLRTQARHSGRRIYDLARDVVSGLNPVS